jgi:IS30 family transposase
VQLWAGSLAELGPISDLLINRPRRVLDYQTPMEVFVNLLGRAKLGELAAKQVNVQ